MAVLTDKQLAAQIRNWRKKNLDGAPFGIRTDQEFRGNRRLEVDGRAYEVAECRSDLEARELLARRSGDDGLVLLFRVGHEHLGEDLLARLTKERLLSVDTRQSLRELFQAASIDPRILANPKLVEALVAAAAGRGGVTSPAGILDMDLAWSVLLGNPELVHRRPDLTTLLRWSLDEAQWLEVRGLEPELRKAFFAWVAERAGEATHFIDAAESGGHAETLVPIGLALGVLFQDGGRHEEARLEGRVRIEDYLGKQKIGAGPAMAWHLAAAAIVKEFNELSSFQRADLARRLDQLLKALKVESLAIDSDFSALGFAERTKAFAETLQRYGRRKAGQAGAALGACYQALQNHALSADPNHKKRLPRAEMAGRLALWLKQHDREPNVPRSLEDAMDGYLRELSFVDRARFALFGGDAADHELSQVYHNIAKQAATIRREQQRHFGTLLAAWNEEGGGAGAENLLTVERVVEQVVAPLAKERPVLLLVLDGMSGPVFCEMLEDFARRGWLPAASGGEQQSSARPVLAALPSVTNISRQALFSGKLDGSDKRGEQVAFREHPALAGKGKPQLFLKADLAGPGESFLAEPVRKAIASPSQRVVGVLLNVVDDQLSAGDQLEVEWRIDKIRFLGPALEAATQAGRAIVLTSDHGHIPDLNQTVKTIESSGGGDRYRGGGDRPAGPGELFIQGERIKAATGEEALIAACEETVRYASKKGGYHGGASDLEMVIPLAVLEARTDALDGWLPPEPFAPVWWRWREYLGESTGPLPKTSSRRTKPKPARQEAQLADLPLFGGAAPGPGSESGVPAPWLKRLLDSPVFKQQAQSMGKLTPKEDQVVSFLTVMEKHGNAVLFTTLAADLRLPPFRLPGLLSLLGRLFNVDGYPVLEEDRASQTVRVDRKLLARQFELPD